MKVKDLVEKLKAFDQEADIFFANDEEGNIHHAEVIIHLVDLSNSYDDARKEVVAIYSINGKDDVY